MKLLYPRFILSALLALTLGTASLHAQNSTGTTTYGNANYSLRKWDFGFNIGATWEKSDLSKNYARLGWGFTLGKYWLRNTHSIFDIGLRFRYLVGNARGLDAVPNTGLKNNSGLNGTLYQNIDYYHDTLGGSFSSPGNHVYNNYKMISNEFSLELMLGANRLRQKTGILLYVFGGGGFFYNKTTINQLDANGNMYDYSKIDPTTGSTAVYNSLTSGVLDGSYETQSEGQNNNGWVFAPTLGIGIGKMLSKSTAIGFEHKITFPLHDYLDGQQWSNDNTATGTNDWQHYTGFYLRWYFRANGEYSNTTTNTHTNSNNYTNNNDPNNNPNNNPPPPPPIAKPIITISYPQSNPFNYNANNIVLSGAVQNVNNHNQIFVKVNGYTFNNFSFDPYSHALSINTPLISGTNIIDITATNNAGSDHASQTIIYNDNTNFSGTPPKVIITSPNANPYTTSTNIVNVNATVTGVASSSNIIVNYNGQQVSNFIYDMNSKMLVYSAILNNGSNMLSISANNQYGSDAKSQTLILQNVNNGIPKPVVTIVSPNNNPHTVTSKSCPVTATVTNIDSKNNITITAQGNPVTVFTYDMNSKVLNFSVDMNSQPSVNVVITGTNTAGSDMKSVTLTLPPKENPPVVTITNPGSNPYNTSNNTQAVTASITNITNASQASVKLNGNPVTNFTYNAGQLNFTATLNLGPNTVLITATNNSGSDSKSTTINYQQKKITPAPQVTILSPNTNPYNTSSPTVSITANVINVNSQNEITVKVNGAPTTAFTYDMTNKILLLQNVNLNNGNNTVTITASNIGGTDSKTETIIYTPTAIMPPVVTITFPQANPYEVHAGTITVTAQILNITSQSQASVTALGNVAVPFTYNPTTKVCSFTVTLNPGANNFTVSATNQAGSDSKSVTIKWDGSSNNTGNPDPNGHGNNNNSNNSNNVPNNNPNPKNVPPPNNTGKTNNTPPKTNTTPTPNTKVNGKGDTGKTNTPTPTPTPKDTTKGKGKGG